MAEQNNLKLNCSKSTEIIFRDNRRQHTTAEPAPLSGIARCSCMKMLGVTVGNDFSVSQHVQRLVTSSAQARYALRVLRTGGLDDAALQHVFQATVVLINEYCIVLSILTPCTCSESLLY